MRFGAAWTVRLQRPLRGCLIPVHRGYFCVELDIAAYVEIVGDPFEIFEIMVARRVAIFVRIIVAEQMGIAAARGIDPRAWVAVFKP